MKTTLAILLLFTLNGCILVRTTEHHVRLNEDGSGEGVLRLVDIRSDGADDAAVLQDFGTMMARLKEDGMQDFEDAGRKVVSKRFIVSGDTLMAEIVYSFPTIEAVEGMRVADGKIFLLVNNTRDIVKTNGKIERGDQAVRIEWPLDARHFSFTIREKSIPPSTSLAGLYNQYEHP